MHRQSVRSSSPIFESRKHRCFPISAKNFPSNYIPCTSRFRHIYQTCRGAQKRSTHLFEKTNPTRNTLTILCLDRPLIRTGNRAQIAIRDAFVLAPYQQKRNLIPSIEAPEGNESVASGAGEKAGYPRGDEVGKVKGEGRRAHARLQFNQSSPRGCAPIRRPVNRKRSLGNLGSTGLRGCGRKGTRASPIDATVFSTRNASARMNFHARPRVFVTARLH